MYLGEAIVRSNKLHVQTSVSHSSTECEVISLDVGLRMDGIPALDLMDLVTEELHSSSQQPKSTSCVINIVRNIPTKERRSSPPGRKILDEPKVDYVTPSVIFEAVIKMIIKGRSPTMRHLSRTHQIKYVDAKNQLADIPNKGSFTRDEWNHLLCLFNILSNSVFSCSHLSSQIDGSGAMSKRQMQEKQQGR